MNLCMYQCLLCRAVKACPPGRIKLGNEVSATKLTKRISKMDKQNSKGKSLSLGGICSSINFMEEDKNL